MNLALGIREASLELRAAVEAYKVCNLAANAFPERMVASSFRVFSTALCICSPECFTMSARDELI